MSPTAHQGRVACETCGAELEDAAQRFCGGDRCLHVLMRVPERAGRQSRARGYRFDADHAGWRERTPPMGTIGYTGSYQECFGEVIEVSVVSVLEARGPE